MDHSLRKLQASRIPVHTYLLLDQVSAFPADEASYVSRGVVIGGTQFL